MLPKKILRLDVMEKRDENFARIGVTELKHHEECMDFRALFKKYRVRHSDHEPEGRQQGAREEKGQARKEKVLTRFKFKSPANVLKYE